MSVSAQIVEFIATNGFWTGPLSFALALFSSILGPNFFIPAGTILVSVGTLAGSDLIQWTVCLWAAAGAACGSIVSFALGVWLGPVILQTRFLAKRRDLVERAHVLFETYGFAAIFVGYFSGPLRAVVVATAAVAGMSPLRFHIVNVVAALVWGPVFIAQGAIFGALVDRGQPWFLLVPIGAPLILAAVSVVATLVWRFFWRRGKAARAER
jgi:membrane protein DedA with SNARE-associated domain